MGMRISDITRPMLSAASAELGDKWPDIKTYAEAEAKKLAQTLVMIEKLKLQGTITKQQAKLLVDMQRQASRVVLLTIENLTLLAAEAAINAAMKAAKDVVNTAIGWKLL